MFYGDAEALLLKHRALLRKHRALLLCSTYLRAEACEGLDDVGKVDLIESYAINPKTLR